LTGRAGGFCVRRKAQLEPVPENRDKPATLPLAPPQPSLPKGVEAIRGIGEKFTQTPRQGSGPRARQFVRKLEHYGGQRSLNTITDELSK